MFQFKSLFWVVLLAGTHVVVAFGDELNSTAVTATGAQHKPLFYKQYHLPDPSFCYASACVDFDGDGQRDLFFASRETRELTRLNAADGKVVWSKPFVGEQQSISAFDLNGKGTFELIYTVSSPGQMYVVDENGNVLRQWHSDDGKLGNSPVIIDSNRDGVLDGYLGSRTRYLVRLDMQGLSLIQRREGWSQCGCHTSAMDVDRDGRWDLFAGNGDDYQAKGVFHRFDPESLKTLWEFETNDNASSADPVLADIDGDGLVEIIKSVDNYKGDDAHDAVYAFTTDGKMLWKVEGLAGEDSPNVADLDGDGQVEIVGMTFGGEVYCLSSRGEIRWKRDLRPDCSNATHMYVTPILCDVNGDAQLEIVAMTSDSYFDTTDQQKDRRSAILFALNAKGDVLDQFDLGSARYFCEAFVCQLDDDPYLELVMSGSGGLDVIETRGLGPDTEYFQRRRNYQRLNVLPWAYEDSFFIERGTKQGLVHETDNLVLARQESGYVSHGQFVTAPFSLPPGCEFGRLEFDVETPAATDVRVDVIDEESQTVLQDLTSGTDLGLRDRVRLAFRFSTTNPQVTPKLHEYSLAFHRQPEKVSGAADQGGPPAAVAVGQTVQVEAGPHPRIDTPVSVALSIPSAEWKSPDGRVPGVVEIVEGRSNRIPSQIEPGKPPRLWWTATGETRVGQKRTYRVDLVKPGKAPGVSVDRQASFVEIRVKDAPVLRYNSAIVAPPKDTDPAFARSGFIHPLRTPSGTLVTEQFPADHPHQDGVFLAYTKTEFEGRTPNFWDLLAGNGRVRSSGVHRARGGPVFGEIVVEQEHVDTSGPAEKVALREFWTIRFWNQANPDAGFFLCDVTSELRCASDSPVRLLEHHYGGMAIRGAHEWDHKHAIIVTSKGQDRVAGNHTRPRWCDLGGPVGDRTAGVAFLTHPSNFRYPEPLRIHPNMPYMVYTPSFLGDWMIAPGKLHISRYRFIIHDGELPSETADRVWHDFAEPLVAAIVP